MYRTRPTSKNDAVKSLSDFLKRVDQLRSVWFGQRNLPKPGEEGILWFRGQDSAKQGLSPKLYRKEYRGADENEIRHEFESRALQLIQGRVPQTPLEWYFLMQHYSVPTRLLDWSENPLVGLYFAVENHSGNDDAVVWVLDPWWLNRRLKKGVDGPMLPDWEEVARYLPKLEDAFSGMKVRVDLPAAIEPPHVDRHLAVQASRFVIFGRTRDLTKSKTVSMKGKKHLAKIVIPRRSVVDIASELENCGVTLSSLFPDLAGLGKDICNKWKKS